MILDRQSASRYLNEKPQVRPRATMLAAGILIAIAALSIGALLLLSAP
jgi:hypothetical protein